MRGQRSQLLVAAVAAVLGFALVVQVRQTQDAGGLQNARQEDLVRILDDLTARAERLRADIEALRASRDRLTTGIDREAVALEEAQRRAQALGILAGTLPARGPGVLLTIADPERTVTAEDLLDAVQELRDAGAEVIQLNTVRLVASSYVVEGDLGIEVDGKRLGPAYRFLAIGDGRTLAEAMDIPGGVIDVIAARPGARATVAVRPEVVISALRPLSAPRYARPAPRPDAS